LVLTIVPFLFKSRDTPRPYMTERDVSLPGEISGLEFGADFDI
jgi:hypothetical protein